jgi:hypothetical protein
MLRRPSGIWRRGTPEERSSSPSDVTSRSRCGVSDLDGRVWSSSGDAGPVGLGLAAADSAAVVPVNGAAAHPGCVGAPTRDFRRPAAAPDHGPARRQVAGPGSRVRVRPSPGDQLTVPAQQGRRGDEERRPTVAGQQPRQYRQHTRSAGWRSGRCTWRRRTVTWWRSTSISASLRRHRGRAGSTFVVLGARVCRTWRMSRYTSDSVMATSMAAASGPSSHRTALHTAELSIRAPHGETPPSDPTTRECRGRGYGTFCDHEA